MLSQETCHQCEMIRIFIVGFWPSELQPRVCRIDQFSPRARQALKAPGSNGGLFAARYLAAAAVFFNLSASSHGRIFTYIEVRTEFDLRFRQRGTTGAACNNTTFSTA